MKRKKNNIKKNFIWNMIGTVVNSFTSLFFMIIVVRINSIKFSGIFSFAFSMACLFYIIGIYCGRVFQVTDNDKENDDFSYINFRFITVFIMVFLAFLFCIIRNYTFSKFSIIMLLIFFKALEAISDVFFAITQKKDNLYKVGISMFVKSLICVISFLFVDLITKNILLSILTIVIINVICLLCYDIPSSEIDFSKYYFNKAKIYKLFKIGFFTFIFTFLNLYLINIPKYAIEFFMNDSFQSIFGIIVMPATVISLVAQFIIFPFLNDIKTQVKEKEFSKLSKLMTKLIVVTIFFGIISIIFMYFFGVPILNIIYGINLMKYKIDLVIILIGAICYAVTTIFANVLIVFRKTLSQAIIYFIVSLVSTIIAMFFVKFWGIKGATISYLITLVFIVIIFYILTCIVIKKEKGRN